MSSQYFGSGGNSAALLIEGAVKLQRRRLP
jgi:hypothetical protein